MKITLIMGLMAMAIAMVRADVVIEQTTRTSVKTVADGALTTASRTVTKVKGDRARIDVGDESSRIIDITSFEGVTLFHKEKRFVRNGKVDMAALKVSLEDLVDAQAKPVKTGRTEKVGDYLCDVWEVSLPHGGSKVTVWASKDYPDGAAIKAELIKRAGTFSAGLPFGYEVEGLGLKVSFGKSRSFLTCTVDFARVIDVDDAEFEIPAGYQEGKAR